MTHFELLSTAGLLVSFTSWVAYHVQLRRDLYVTCRETSRYPLFGIRRRLVQLVAEEKMSEDDDAWKTMYRSVNELLGLHQSLHAIDLLRRYVKVQLMIRRDADARRRFERMLETEAKAAQRVPEFGEVRKDMEGALMHLVERRTTPWHQALMFISYAIVKVLAVALSAGATTATYLASALREPSARNLRKLAIR